MMLPPEITKPPKTIDFFPELSSDDQTDLTSIVNSVPAVVYTYTLNHDTGDCHFPFVSGYCQQMFGLPPSKIIEDSETFVNLVHPDDVNAFAASVLDSMKNLTTWDFKMRMRDRDSRIVWVHGKSQPRRRQVTNEDGSKTTFTIWYGILYDITGDQTEPSTLMSPRKKNNSKTAEDDLPPQNQQHPLVVSDEPYFETNKKGVITHWNYHMAELSGGILEENVLGQNVMSLVCDTSQERAKVNAILNKTLIKEDDDLRYFNESTHDIVLKSKRAQNVHLRMSTECLHGNLLGWTCKGITALKSSAVVKMDTAKLLDQEKSLTEWLSHEIRNPLSIAQEAAEFLLSSDQYPVSPENYERDQKENFQSRDTQSFASLIKESIRHVVDLLNNMLDLRKLSDGKIQLRPSMYSLKEDIIRPVHKMLDVKGHNVAMSMSGEDFSVFIDKLRLKQILTNLLSNALKFTHHGYIKIKSYRTNKNLNGYDIEDSLVVSISDSGCGINNKEKDKLFTKWEQLGTNIHGAGLGLCLSRFLARSMGGDLHFNEKYDSKVPGCPGAQFMIRFPLRTILASSKDGCTSHKAPAYSTLSAAVTLSEKEHEINLSKDLSEIKYRNDLTNNSYVVGKFKCAIIDDVEVVRKLIKRRLERLFPEAITTEFNCGEKIIEASKQELYDMIFIDQFMGDGLKGDETILRLRDNNINSYIVGISGNKKEMCHKTAGGDDFFQKPLPSQVILAQRIATKITLPSAWRVIIVDPNEASSRLLKRKLHRIATPHPTKSSNFERHMNIETVHSIQDAECKLKSEWFDLVILASLEFHYEKELSSTSASDLIYFIRRNSQNKCSIIVLNSASVYDVPRPQLFNIFWSKPLPTLEVMKKSLINELIKH